MNTTEEPTSTDEPSSTAKEPSDAAVVYGVVVLIGIVAAVIWGIVAIVGGGSHGEVSDIEYSVTNPSTLQVVWTVAGESGESVDCTVKATDPSHTYDGWEVVTHVTLYGEPRTVMTPVSINTEGAAFVTQVTVEC